MLFLVKLFPEITIKSRPVRLRLVRRLRRNIRTLTTEVDAAVRVSGEWDRLEVECSVAAAPRVRERLACTPGIARFLEVDRHPLPDLNGILELARAIHAERLPGKTFAVRCKRSGAHPFRSTDVERFVGAGLGEAAPSARVQLQDPEVTVAMEIREDRLYMIRKQFKGLGGFPLGGQDAVLSLISGGFDSAVSSFLSMRRGLQTHYCFFNLGGRAHELAVKEVALYLWMKYHASQRVKFVSVPFEGVVKEILERVGNPYMGVVLKRMMLRAAARIAERLQAPALVTGESVGQVSSQTLANLAVIDQVTDCLVMRPLGTADKQSIIDLARDIGTEEFSRQIPEYCAVISRNPTTRARPERVEREEARFDFKVLEQALANGRYQWITDVATDFNQGLPAVEIVGSAGAGELVIDIRHPTEIEASPLCLPATAELLAIPFYRLRTGLDGVDADRKFLLYCDKGMMSRLHAAHLQDQGFRNVAVLDPRIGK